MTHTATDGGWAPATPLNTKDTVTARGRQPRGGEGWDSPGGRDRADKRFRRRRRNRLSAIRRRGKQIDANSGTATAASLVLPNPGPSRCRVGVPRGARRLRTPAGVWARGSGWWRRLRGRTDGGGDSVADEQNGGSRPSGGGRRAGTRRRRTADLAYGVVPGNVGGVPLTPHTGAAIAVVLGEFAAPNRALIAAVLQMLIWRSYSRDRRHELGNA